MDAKKRRLMAVLLVGGFLFAGLIMLNGCGQDEPEPVDVNDENSETAMTTETGTQVAGTEQTTCPVMEGSAINKAIFVEHEGKKVYFCCPPCKAKFADKPEEYIAKLPQFKE